MAISFGRLQDDTPDRCPVSEEEVFEYVRMESADSDESDKSRLEFLRTAVVTNVKYWVWKYTEIDGLAQFVTVKAAPDDSSRLSLAEPNGLSLEQFLLADYYDEVYWSCLLYTSRCV